MERIIGTFNLPHGPHNRRWYGAIGILIVTLLVSVPPSALSAGETATITLSDALRTALKSNVTLQRAATLVDSRAAAVGRSRAAFLPDLGVSLRTSRWYGKEYDAASGRFDGASSTAMNLGISSSLDLFTGFGRLSDLRRSAIELEGERRNLERTRQTVLFEALSRFVTVAAAREFIDVGERNLEAQKNQRELVAAFKTAGKRPIADLYQQEAELADAERLLLKAKRDCSVATLSLLEWMGVDPGTDCRIDPPDVDGMLATLEGLESEDNMARALSRRPDLLAQEKSVSAAREQISTSRSGYWPTLSLTANAGTSYSSTQTETFGFSDQFYENNPNATVGLSLSVPVFDRFVTRNSVVQARISLKQAGYDLEQLKLQIGVEVRQAMEDYTTAKKEVEVAEARLEYTHQALRSIEERYRVGASTFVELSQARAADLQASYDVINARYGLLVNGFAVVYYRGDIEEALSVF
jgi:outer membrane protein